ncbi:unnamed protein product [Ectocarpus sp. 12 AP-2014]
MGAAHGQEASATPGPVLRSVCQQLQQTFVCSAAFLIPFRFVGAVWRKIRIASAALAVDNCLVRPPSQQQVHRFQLHVVARQMQGFSSSRVSRVNVCAQLQESEHASARANVGGCFMERRLSMIHRASMSAPASMSAGMTAGFFEARCRTVFL